MSKTGAMLTAILVMALVAVPAFGKVWKVNNNPGVVTDFTTLQEAHDDARVQPDDTLYVYGSPNNYGPLKLTKSLKIFGPGYFLDENPNTQTGFLHTATETIQYEAGSEDSLLSGVAVYWGRILVNTNNITITSCLVYWNQGEQAAVSITGDNAVITKNYILGTTFASGLTVNGYNNLIANNFLGCSVNLSYRSSASLRTDSNGSYHIKNNVLSGDVFVASASFENNIHPWADFSATACNIRNNIGYADQFGTENGNQSNIDMTTVFVDEGSTDGQWQLKPDSPAIGAGVSGEDCGMFGGPNPYVLSGIPAIPHIYAVDGPSSGSAASGIPLKIKIKSN